MEQDVSVHIENGAPSAVVLKVEKFECEDQFFAQLRTAYQSLASQRPDHVCVGFGARYKANSREMRAHQRHVRGRERSIVMHNQWVRLVEEAVEALQRCDRVASTRTSEEDVDFNWPLPWYADGM